MNRRTFIGVALSSLATAWGAMAGIDDGWKELGRRTVDLGLDKDVIKCGFSGQLRALCIEVRRAPVNFLDVKVVLGSGESIDFPVKSTVSAGSRSRVFDLPGSRRVVNRVEFWHKPARGKKAEIILWGKE